MHYGKIRLTLRFDAESNCQGHIYVSSTQRFYSQTGMTLPSFIIQLYLSKLSDETVYRQTAAVVAYGDHHSLITPYDMRAYFRYKVFGESGGHPVNLVPRASHFIHTMRLFEQSVTNGKMPLMFGNQRTGKVKRVERKK